jgi:hypothetical protein
VPKSEIVRRRSRPERRGVLMLVVLSVLVLFMLIGTAFLMTSKHENDSAKGYAKDDRVGNKPDKELDRALRNLLRDTENPHSVARYHSLLRDLYGGDGFQAVVQRGEYAGVTELGGAGTGGPTIGQLIDIYITLDTTVTPPVAAYKIDRDPLGQIVPHPLATTRGYYNGQLLTIARGPAAGQTTRILDYEVVNRDAMTGTPTQWRFRVMSFPRTDGQPLVSNSVAPFEITDLTNVVFLVNGRALNGTGAGYNPLARLGDGRLNAVEFGQVAGDWLGMEVALTPNPVHLNLPTVGASNPAITPPGFDPFVAGRTSNPFLTLNITSPLNFTYPNFPGLGDADESYDAPDHQNIWLASQTVLPRPRGRFVAAVGQTSAPTLFEVDDTTVGGSFLRFDLEDLPKPSFHDMALVNFWYHRLMTYLVASGLSEQEAVQGIALPYYAMGNVNPVFDDPQKAALVAFIKRKIMLRPSRDDHPNFDGGNPASVAAYAPLTMVPPPFPTYVTNGTINYPFPEIVGPWDVDNDNDGVPDSVWIDLGDPVLETENGTRYKPLYAVLIVDLDSRLNVNAHGTSEHVITGRGGPTALPLARDATGTPRYTISLPQGSGWGVGDISLRPIMPVSSFANIGNVAFDDYARLLYGRPSGGNFPGVYGRNGSYDIALRSTANPASSLRPGMTFDNSTPVSALATSDPLSYLKFIGHPLFVGNYYTGPAPGGIYLPTAFGTPPDLMGRYRLGLDFTGQPAVEAAADSASATIGPNYSLLMDSPYEIDLSSPTRKDTPDPARIEAMAAGLSPPFNEDAPFATADLERILRAPDADAGTLPSRLWEVVSAFDPQRLGADHTGLVDTTAADLFGGTTPPEQLAAAQLLASIHRHNVTTDSYGPPVPGITPPGYMLTHSNATVQAALNLRTPKNVAELFEVRIRRQAGWPTMYDEYDPNGDHDGDGTPNANDSADYDNDAANRNARAAHISAIINGGIWKDASGVDHVEAAIVAPELLAGLRIDINRPLGDGRDNGNAGDDDGNGSIDDASELGRDSMLNGVVDDPLEAGEPFLDLNGDGKQFGTEPHINLDDQLRFSPSRDRLWPELTASGLLEPVAFDYLNGYGEPVHPALGFPPEAQVRNLESQGRQRLARQLYCLMLLLSDENYVAPIDELDPQVLSWLEIEKKKLEPALIADGLSQAQATTAAELIARRKLTCREIAQWAINVVDMRDADAIMTPFEYDDNPFDGWGVFDANGIIIPLDGDPATDENAGDVIDWPASNGGPKVVRTTSTMPPTPITPSPDPRHYTRGLVWGAERPDLLITETIAWHDRQTEDLDNNGQGDGHKVKGPMPDGDQTPDQRLRPKATLFVEVNNPWSLDGQYPLEIYSRVDSTTGTTTVRPGVELGRLSNLAAWDIGNAADPYGNGAMRLTTAPTSERVRRSPVWRFVTVSEKPDYRNVDDADDKRLDVVDLGNSAYNIAASAPAASHAGIRKAYTDAAARVRAWKPAPAVPLPPFRPTNLDLPGVFDFSFLPRPRRANSVPPDGEPYLWEVKYPHIEREFYLTTDNSPAVYYLPGTYQMQPPGAKALHDVTHASFRLRIPRSRVISHRFGTGAGQLPQLLSEQTQKFIALDPTRDAINDPADQPIGPVLPGRYAVIGSAGANYAGLPAGNFTTTIGRRQIGNNPRTDDTTHYQANRLLETRRIELFPSANFDTQQVFVRSNGGNPAASPLKRQNELIGTGQNVYDDADLATAGVQPTFQPSVAVPVDGMNISEPMWGWAVVEYPQKRNEFMSGTTPLYKYTRGVEGSYQLADINNTQVSFDIPFDTLMGAPELIRNGTTANYRTIHLQRLANPLLPWNPLPGEADHRPGLPVNPYRTIDLSSVDLTAFDGASAAEHGTATNTNDKYRPFSKNPAEGRGRFMNNRDDQQWYFKSLERGIYARFGLVNPTPTVAFPAQRSLWAQEPVIGTVRGDFDDATKTNLSYREIRGGWRATTGERIPQQPGDPEDPDDPARSGVPQNIQDQQQIRSNFWDMTIEHTLGFGNESMGELYTRNDVTSRGLPQSAIGAPKPYPVKDAAGNPIKDANGNDVLDQATYPWLAWGNRPFASAAEILQVPSASSAKMLARFSMINPDLPIDEQPNPYDWGIGNPNAGLPTEFRQGMMGAPYGHLLNMFASASFPAAFPVGRGGPSPNGAPNFYRILDYIHVPSRFIGTETVLSPAVFNDVPGAADPAATGGDIAGPSDPRYLLQPPFNKVSRQREPGRVNLNTVTGRRRILSGVPLIWSDIFDGIMHRVNDSYQTPTLLGHFGPAWRDVLLSRRGYQQIDATDTPVDQIPGANGSIPDTLSQGLNRFFPTFVANPFRSPDAGDLVPLAHMIQSGVDVTWQRRHHYSPIGQTDPPINRWGLAGANNLGLDDDGNQIIDDIHEAGYGDDTITADHATGRLITGDSRVPLFSETFSAPYFHGERNPGMMYQPMTRLGNLVTNRSNVFAVWITVGYFEVEPAPPFANVGARFGDISTPAGLAAAQALYNRVYPEGYTLGREVGSETGNIRRHRGFYIIDRSAEVGFKPGEDLNVEKMILLRRRID